MIQKILEWLAEKVLVAFSAVVGPLLQRRRLALAIAVASVLLAAGLAYWYWIRTTRYEEIVLTTLKRECYPTPQKYKGLEAFIVSTLPAVPKVEDSLAGRSLSPTFCEILRKIPNTLTSFRGYPPESPQALNEATGGLHVTQGKGGILLTDKVEDSVLFLPVQVLRPSFTESERNLLRGNSPNESTQRDKLLKQALSADPYLQNDIRFTAALAPILHELATTPVTTDTADRPLQVYVVTKNGLNRISNGNSATSSAYQFPETTFFPSRPYFWPTFDEIGPRFYAKTLERIAPDENAKVGDYFRISKPYMDLAGKGLVLTITRGILVDNFPLAALCIDLPVQNAESLYNLVETRAKTLGGRSVKVDCTVDYPADCSSVDGHESGNSATDVLLRHMENELNDRMARKNLAEIRGNIIVFQKDATPGAGLIEASLPLRGIEGDREQFLLISLDLADYRHATALIAFAAASLIGLATLLLAYVAGLHAKQSQDYEKAFSRVAQVMVESPVPYLRLDSKDMIRDFSGSFLELIKMSPEEATTLSAMSLRSLLADDESKEKYDKVEASRRCHKRVSPYHVKLLRKDETIVQVKIVSAAVPAPGGGDMPETFGLLLRGSEESLVHAELVEAAKQSQTEA